MKKTVIVVTIFLLLLAACDNADNPVNSINPDNSVNPGADSPAGSNPLTIAYSAVGYDVSRFLGWQWAKEDSDFTWIFKNDGTVSVIHCCGLVFDRQYSYLLRGSVLITYGSETAADEIEATVFTMTETDGVSFTRDNGTSFTRGDPDNGSSPDSPLGLSNDLLGTWQEDDGTEWEFRSDTGLRISSSDGQYGYLVRYKELLTLGPLVDGTPAVLQKYQFNRSGNKLYLRRSDGIKYTLSLSE